MKKKTKIYAFCAIAVFFLFTSIITSKWNAIFQRGNPIPYLAAAVKLSDENTFEEVENMEGIYITKRGEKQDLFQMVQNTYDVEYKDQLGSAHLFSDGEKTILSVQKYTGVDLLFGHCPLMTVFRVS